MPNKYLGILLEKLSCVKSSFLIPDTHTNCDNHVFDSSLFSHHYSAHKNSDCTTNSAIVSCRYQAPRCLLTALVTKNSLPWYTLDIQHFAGSVQVSVHAPNSDSHAQLEHPRNLTVHQLIPCYSFLDKRSPPKRPQPRASTQTTQWRSPAPLGAPSNSPPLDFWTSCENACTAFRHLVWSPPGFMVKEWVRGGHLGGFQALLPPLELAGLTGGPEEGLCPSCVAGPPFPGGSGTLCGSCSPKGLAVLNSNEGPGASGCRQAPGLSPSYATLAGLPSCRCGTVSGAMASRRQSLYTIERQLQQITTIFQEGQLLGC